MDKQNHEIIIYFPLQMEGNNYLRIKATIAELFTFFIWKLLCEFY